MYYFTLLVSLKTRPGQPVLCCCFAHPLSDCECSRLKTQIKTQGKQDSLCCHSRSSWAQHHMFLVARVKWQRRWTLYDYLSLSLSLAPPLFFLCVCVIVCVWFHLQFFSVRCWPGVLVLPQWSVCVCVFMYVLYVHMHMFCTRVNVYTAVQACQCVPKSTAGSGLWRKY